MNLLNKSSGFVSAALAAIRAGGEVRPAALVDVPARGEVCLSSCENGNSGRIARL